MDLMGFFLFELLSDFTATKTIKRLLSDVKEGRKEVSSLSKRERQWLKEVLEQGKQQREINENLQKLYREIGG
jgi:hypothetical protein